MSAELMQAKHHLELKRLQELIESELELESRLFEASSQIPSPSLSIVLEPDGSGSSRVANLMFLPIDDEDMESIKLLQLYCELPIQITSETLPDLEQLLHEVNLTVPLGAYSINTNRQLIFKYVYVLSKFKETDPAEFLETFLLWMYILDNINMLVDALIEGQTDLQAALQALNS
ncbi:hypothetical protein IQ241_15980 [Romeria aff. gracilis LEGE 07310]|uniref:Uncharacterized protein n=1 Tax=Vasconcelosia minhoensis LEGE 07310 TaxID=915328 RepID=A0A8J7AYR4_9CYAN|nr:hypothetical protein [Romeria gracilis]MBE9078777.1 hypothetical protein [Romeria aff. gracilis LEGE 07310]